VKSNTPEHAKHPDELLLLYVENMLVPDEKTKLETHLKECEDCSARAQALRDTIAALKDAREIFCSEPWEIYEFVEKGKPEGTVSSHLALCNPCREEAANYDIASAERMPAELWNRIQERVPKSREASRHDSGAVSRLIERLHGWFRFPTIAVGAAVAAILVVLVLYPGPFTQPGVGLTSVTWDDALKPKAFQKAAVLLLFKDFKPPMPQARVDSIYESLKPDMEVSARYSMVSPAVLSAAIKNREIDASDETRLLSGLHNKFNVSQAVLVDISRAGHAYDVRVNVMDTGSGKELHVTTLRDVPDIRLNERLREAVAGLLLREN
jgi:hypothetical protein